MSRFFRLYEKKRGDRRTGSKTFGSFGEALFFGFFFVIGCAALAFMVAALVWPEWRANRQFVPATCVILGKQVGTIPASESEPARYRPAFHIRYTADGRNYDAEDVYDVTNFDSTDKAQAEVILERFDLGKEYPCWYDPIDHARVVLVRGYSGWLYLTLLIPLSFIVIGGGRLIYTLIHWNASAERRALVDQRTAQLDLFDVESAKTKFPNVPADANLTNSPGTTLAYRLPLATTTSWALFAAAAACFLWNGIAMIFVVMAINDFARGQPDWPLAALVVPVLAVGVWLIVRLARQILMTTGVGPTLIEISDHPLGPGEPYDVFVSQAGRVAISALELWLACDERATYRQGTDTRTETRRVYEARCFVRENFEIHQGLPFESRCQVCVPSSAMHSFQSNHNEVNWKLIVKGDVVGWPSYERVFQIVVTPANGHLPG